MDFLDDIKRAEREAEELIAKAKQDSDELVRTAKFETRKLIESIKEECDQVESRMISEAESAAQIRSDEARKENLKVLESLRKSAGENVDPAAKLIIDSISGKP